MLKRPASDFRKAFWLKHNSSEEYKTTSQFSVALRRNDEYHIKISYGIPHFLTLLKKDKSSVKKLIFSKSFELPILYLCIDPLISKIKKQEENPMA